MDCSESRFGVTQAYARASTRAVRGWQTRPIVPNLDHELVSIDARHNTQLSRGASLTNSMANGVFDEMRIQEGPPAGPTDRPRT